MYACFSGSDWCGWCKKLEREVFSKKKFLAGVTNDFELVYIDMPQDKSLLSERAAEENPKLVEKYRIQGFPSALVFDASGEVISQMGYEAGGPAKYAKHMMQIRADGPKLVEIAKLAKKHISPFEENFGAAIKETLFDKMDTAMKDVPGEEQEAKAEELLPLFIPECLAKLEPLLAEFKAAEVPEESAEKKAQAIKSAEGFIKSLKRRIEKTSRPKTT